MLATLLATCAATLLEAAPFVLAGALLARVPRHGAWVVPFFGCGCGTGPSARSLPAAIATCAVFGPLVAGLRLAAAIAVDRVANRSRCAGHTSGPLNDLHMLLPAACAAACAAPFAPALFGRHIPPAGAFFAGAAAAFAWAPCALGTPAIAASLRHTIPAAAAGVLCIAGIADARVWFAARSPVRRHDALAYALASIACANVAAHRGAALVHPKLVPLLWLCAPLFAWLAFRHRSERCGLVRIAPVIMLAGSVLAAPAPEYHATQTSLERAFPGERLDFTGIVTRTGDAVTLVRYAITCCRADAAPITVRLTQAPHSLRGWVRARGVLVERDDRLLLAPVRLEAIESPADPFVYR